MSSSKNLEFEKTSFLNKSNSAFIEQMYLKFINKDEDLPESWKDYFQGIGEESCNYSHFLKSCQSKLSWRFIWIFKNGL